MLEQVFVLQQVLLSHVSENFLPTKGIPSKGRVIKLLSGQVPGIGSQSTQNIILLWLTGNCGAMLAVKLSLRRKIHRKTYQIQGARERPVRDCKKEIGKPACNGMFAEEASVIFDGTARLGEALAVIVRYVQENFQPTQRLIRLDILAKALK